MAKWESDREKTRTIDGHYSHAKLRSISNPFGWDAFWK